MKLGISKISSSQFIKTGLQIDDNWSIMQTKPSEDIMLELKSAPEKQKKLCESGLRDFGDTVRHGVAAVGARFSMERIHEVSESTLRYDNAFAYTRR